jgi:hypothetical protein
LHERVRPFNKLLGWELGTNPLPGAPWSRDVLLPQLREILETGDISMQQSLFRDVEALVRDHGLSRVSDGREPDLAWLRGENDERARV